MNINTNDAALQDGKRRNTIMLREHFDYTTDVCLYNASSDHFTYFILHKDMRKTHYTSGRTKSFSASLNDLVRPDRYDASFVRLYTRRSEMIWRRIIRL